MSATLEQTAGDLSFLKGATVAGVRVRKARNRYDTDAIVLTLRTRVTVADGDARGRTVDLEVWQDVEGNGPGYLALTAIRP